MDWKLGCKERRGVTYTDYPLINSRGSCFDYA